MAALDAERVEQTDHVGGEQRIAESGVVGGRMTHAAIVRHDQLILLRQRLDDLRRPVFGGAAQPHDHHHRLALADQLVADRNAIGVDLIDRAALRVLRDLFARGRDRIGNRQTGAYQQREGK